MRWKLSCRSPDQEVAARSGYQRFRFYPTHFRIVGALSDGLESMIDDLSERGWSQSGPATYRHYCGARVSRLGRFWNAFGASGISLGGYATTSDAVMHVETHDSAFWSYGNPATFGGYSGIRFDTGEIEAGGEDRGFVCYWLGETDFPSFLESTFAKYFFGHARCRKCSGAMAAINARRLPYFQGRHSRHYFFAVCDCGHPAWELDVPLLELHHAIKQKEKSWRRQRLASAEGRHTSEELSEIAAIQENRCLYRNVEFSDQNKPTKDHLLTLADGGTNWPLNIVLACRRCNSRRCDIPFRTYCTLLSQKQNVRILGRLKRRLLGL